MSVPAAGGWLWKRVTFVNPLPLANAWCKKSKAAGERAIARVLISVAFFCAFIRMGDV
jgi:hypothetical protein